MIHLREKKEEKNQKNKEERIPLPPPRECARENWVNPAESKYRVYFSLDEFMQHFTAYTFNNRADRVGLTASQRVAWLAYMQKVDWSYIDGDQVCEKNCMRSMRMWQKYDKLLAKEQGPRFTTNMCNGKASLNDYEAQKQRDAAKRKALAADAANWELCAERCSCYCKSKCACGCAIPPQLRERPIAPEECAGFQRKTV